MGTFDFTSSFFHTRFCETCRWDVPAAAVIHPHKLLLRLRSVHFILLQTSLLPTSLLWLCHLRSTQFLLFSLTDFLYVCDLHFSHINFFNFLSYTSSLAYLHFFSSLIHNTHCIYVRLTHAFTCWIRLTLFLESTLFCVYSNFIRTHFIIPLPLHTSLLLLCWSSCLLSSCCLVAHYVVGTLHVSFEISTSWRAFTQTTCIRCRASKGTLVVELTRTNVVRSGDSRTNPG